MSESEGSSSNLNGGSNGEANGKVLEMEEEYEELISFDDHVEFDDSSSSVTSSASNQTNEKKSTSKKYVGEKAMLAEAQRKYQFSTESKRSQRIQQKKRKRYTDGRVTVLATDYDNCDCLIPDCSGCHYPCKKCGDRRCGLDCRRGRRFVYTMLEIEGTDIVRKNPFANQD